MTPEEMQSYEGLFIQCGTEVGGPLRGQPCRMKHPSTGLKGTKDGYIVSVREELAKGQVPGTGRVKLSIRLSHGTAMRDTDHEVDFNDPCWRLRFAKNGKRP